MEEFTAIIAGVCHDYAHDGFNNGWHVNKQTERFIAHGSAGVQEKHHFAESFKLIEQTQLLAGLSASQLNSFKKLMQQCIYATDMGRHMNDLNELKALVESIPEGADLMPTKLDEAEKDHRRS